MLLFWGGANNYWNAVDFEPCSYEEVIKRSLTKYLWTLKNRFPTQNNTPWLKEIKNGSGE